MSEWQPIETAPRNGEPVLAHHPSWHQVGLVQWVALMGGRWFDFGSGDDLSPQPTHWMPLPEPPK